MKGDCKTVYATQDGLNYVDVYEKVLTSIVRYSGNIYRNEKKRKIHFNLTDS